MIRINKVQSLSAAHPAAAGSAPKTSRGRLLRGPILMALICLFSGCTSLLSPISGIPARRLPGEFLAQPRANWQPINLARLRQEPPSRYLLDAGDVMGIYIEGVLGQVEEAPPVHFPEEGSQLPPAIGFPMPVRDDGTLSLPLIKPLNVRDLTVGQAEDLIRKAYTVDREILQPGRDRIVVTLVRERRYPIIVVRQDGPEEIALPGAGAGGGGIGRAVISGGAQKGTGHVIDLPAYKNDLLHALAETGGLPGLNAKNEVKIMRAKLANVQERDAFVSAFYAQYSHDTCSCPPPLPEDPSVLRIPLRLPPGVPPSFRPEDIILEAGDIVYIESRDTELFYTGGLLPGGQFPLPRDYDLDVLGALAVAGRGVGGGNATGGGGGATGGLIGGLGGAAPTQLFILRKTPCNGQVVISVDINRAIQNTRERLLIQPGDTLILRYKPQEELLNFSLATFFTYGISQLLSGN
jgi:hypothetical protein